MSTTRNPRRLLNETEILQVTQAVQWAHPGMDFDLAERIVMQTLAYVDTVSHSGPDATLAAPPAIAAGWQVLVLHTRVYARLNCLFRVYGNDVPVHHTPQDPAAPPDPGAVDQTAAAVAATGYLVDADLWQPGLSVADLIAAASEAPSEATVPHGSEPSVGRAHCGP
ncbi:hypothetical protein ACFYVL_17125 [Streptomyces sp. NPDC004111]|uniref:hypothetical protein n=1 Tax=Streptomyces sp. NPDC004111 TaxID=3364690 RepID=UPI003693B8D3